MQLEFELAYFEAAIQHFSHYTTSTSYGYISVMGKWLKWQEVMFT